MRRVDHFQPRSDRNRAMQDQTLDAVVEMMERRHIKRIPVTRGGHMVGIISRANLMHALASLARDDNTAAPVGERRSATSSWP
jgi:CBS domain-containing protein